MLGYRAQASPSRYLPHSLSPCVCLLDCVCSVSDGYDVSVKDLLYSTTLLPLYTLLFPTLLCYSLLYFLYMLTLLYTILLYYLETHAFTQLVVPCSPTRTPARPLWRPHSSSPWAPWAPCTPPRVSPTWVSPASPPRTLGGRV